MTKIVGLLVCLSIVPAPGFAALPEASGYINDFAQVLSPDLRQRLVRRVLSLKDATGYELAVVTLTTLDDEPIEEYATRLLEAWGIGKRGVDNRVVGQVPNRRSETRRAACKRMEVGMNPEDIEEAIELALRVHRGQRDKAGRAYILHPLRLMLTQDTDAARIVAILHDVIEDSAQSDSPITPEELRRLGYCDDIVDAIEALTRRKGETYEDFISRLLPNPLARRVKLADLQDNMDLRRLDVFTQEDAARQARYHRAWRRLREAETV